MFVLFQIYIVSDFAFLLVCEAIHGNMGSLLERDIWVHLFKVAKFPINIKHTLILALLYEKLEKEAGRWCSLSSLKFSRSTPVAIVRRLVDAIGTVKDTPEHHQKLYLHVLPPFFSLFFFVCFHYGVFGRHNTR